VASGEETNTYDLTLASRQGRVSVQITGFEMVKINRLEPADRIADRISYTPASVTS
jgi:hypothetical protein